MHSEDTKKDLENAEIEDLKKDKARLEKKVSKLTADLEEGRQQSSYLFNSQPKKN